MSFINFNFSNAAETELKAATDLTAKDVVTVMDSVVDRQSQNPMFKAIIPEYLYKPPFGFPRNINVPFLRAVAKNPYVFSIIKTLQDEAATVKWDIKPKEDLELDEQQEKDRRFAKEFIKNPNDDNESFKTILRKSINDFMVLDSPSWNKIYNQFDELLQFRYVDGGTIVKNPDEHGRLSDRADIIPFEQFMNVNGQNNSTNNQRNQPLNNLNQIQSSAVTFDRAVNSFRSMFGDTAAYFQFSNTLQTSLPIPFGRKEIIYMSMNPDPNNSGYSFCSPLQAAVDITLSLIYGSKYNLDFYMNGNSPEGIIQLAGADPTTIKALRERLDASLYQKDEQTGLNRRIGYRMPITSAADASFVPLSLSSKEMEIIAQQEWFTKILWACMGVTASEMGFGQNSNKATDENQSKVNARKGVMPLLRIVEEHINDQIISELPNGELFEFKFDDFDLEETIKRRTLQEQEIRMGIKSYQMVAAEEGIDLEKLKSDREENQAFEVVDSNIPVNTNKEDNKDSQKQSKGAKTEQKSSSVDSLWDQLTNQLIADIEREGDQLINDAQSRK